jgi:hypothetical protein
MNPGLPGWTDVEDRPHSTPGVSMRGQVKVGKNGRTTDKASANEEPNSSVSFGNGVIFIVVPFSPGLLVLAHTLYDPERAK